MLVTLYAEFSFEARGADTLELVIIGGYAPSTVLARVRNARNYGKQMETE